jgi:O-acetyl-ADP-ribose deacetylase (regulator of RNase III)
MKLALWDTDPAVVQAWSKHFAKLPQVSFGCGDLLEAEVDAVVSPANSAGFMDSGIDRHYRDFFGAKLEYRVRELIALRPDGELPVGQAMVVSTGHPRITRLVVAPTMRLPMRVAGTNHAYLATWAALKRASEVRDPPIACLGLPGMATGVGEMDPDEAAEQMLQAYQQIVGA